VPDVAYGSLPFGEQIAFVRGKVNVPTATWRDVWRDAHDTSFMVAGAYKADLLADFRAAIDKVIADGVTLETFRKDFDQIVASHGWSYNGGRGWRTRVIYETNLRASYQAGRFAQMTDPDLLAARPFWRYVHNDFVAHPRPEHLAWDGLVLRHDDPWWQAHWPPNGWGCRCRVFPESERSLARRGLSVDEAPATRYVTKRIGANGPAPQSVRVPEGIDPGWDYTPGRTVAEQVRNKLAQKAGSLPPALGRQLADTIVNLPAPPPAPATTPVSKALQIPGPRSALGKVANTVLAAIDNVHGDGALPELPVKATASVRYAGMYAVQRFGPPLDISVSRHSPHPELTLAHEIGHFIHHQAIGVPGQFDYPPAVWGEVMAALRGSSSARQLDDALTTRPGDGYTTTKHLQYLLTSHELWARAYAQYIALRSGNQTMRQQIAAMRADANFATARRQWSDEEFMPIAEAIDRMFIGLGWKS
jgi:Phage Mu protein F like protein